MKKKIVVAKINILEGKENEYSALINPLIQATKNELGNLVYILYQNTENSLEFMIYEEYINEEAFAEHGKSKHFQTFVQNVKPLLAKELDIQIF